MEEQQTANAHGLSESISDQAAQLRARTVTSRELTEAALARAHATQPTLNAFKLILDKEALDAADEADRRIAAGESTPLLGVPTAVKDDTDLAGHPTAFGCPGAFPPAAEDAAIVKFLRRDGAVIIGKTNSPELGQSSVTSGPGFGTTRNPWNLDHTPGGSSGGAAAAVAAGVVAAAVGSDGAGSVRIPASWSNLVGIKPTRGRVSSWPEPEAFNGITAIGPLARSVEDAATLLDALTGNDPREIHHLPAPERSFASNAQDDPGRLRIAVSFKIPFSGVPARLDPRVRRQVYGVAETLAALGHDVVERDLTHSNVGLSFLPRSLAGVAEWAARTPDQSLLDHRTRENVRIGRLMGGPALRFARGWEAVVRRRTGRIFRDFDVVVAPTTARPPLTANALDGLSSWATDRLYVGACPYAWPWNVTGWPGISVPAGFIDGLPVGAQLLGQARSEARLIALAAQLERELRWDQQRPPGFGA
ncbi:MAG: amidase [Thermoleophilaceae bacterium]|nr:amidase [Thermoleophilaceae bacterium]